MKKATIFGAARMDKNCKEYLDTIEIGKILAKKGYILQNGGYGGVMEASAKGVKEENGKSYGFTCQSFGYTTANKYITETVICLDIFERLKYMINGVDVFIVQVGGIGTLSELFLTLDEIRKLKNPPKVYLIGNYWNWIFSNPIIPQTCKDLLTVIIDINQLELLL